MAEGQLSLLVSECQVPPLGQVASQGQFLQNMQREENDIICVVIQPWNQTMIMRGSGFLFGDFAVSIIRETIQLKI